MSFEFNTDLLITGKDRDAAHTHFGDIYFALDNQELREHFGPYDEAAKRAKVTSRTWGGLAVMLGTGALTMAATEPILNVQEHVKHILALIAGSMGVVSVLIGLFGLMFRRRKLKWLRARLAAERIRQFHFQSLVTQIPLILEASRNAASRAEFEKERTGRFLSFQRDVVEMIDAEVPPPGERSEARDCWLWEFRGGSVRQDDPALPHLFAAYESLRFRRQIQYAGFKLAGFGRWWRDAPAKQAKAFSTLSMLCVLAIMFIHIGVVCGVAGGPHWLSGQLIHVLAIWIAIVALSARTLEEGLQPAREVERLRTYLSGVKAIHRRFKEAITIEEKVEAMKQMEELAFEEMHLFLESCQESRFLM